MTVRLHVQDSLDGVTWRPLYLVGKPVTFSSKAAAREWFKSFEEANNLDWRVGFLLRCRDGRHYRLVHTNGKEVRA
jgi:hypothetical protein